MPRIMYFRASLRSRTPEKIDKRSRTNFYDSVSACRRDADSQIRWMRWMRWNGVWEELRMNRRVGRPCIPSLATAAAQLGHEPAVGGRLGVARKAIFSPSLASECGGGAKVRPPASSVSPLRPPIRAVTDIRLARLRNLAPPPPLPLTDLQQGCPLAT